MASATTVAVATAAATPTEHFQTRSGG